ncbi:TPA_asm: hypothetical protein, partial [Hydra MELD virus]
MNEELKSAIDKLLKKQLKKLPSRLFGLTNSLQIKNVLLSFDKIKKNPTDLLFYEELKKLLENSIFAKWDGLIQSWYKNTKFFSKTTDVIQKQAPRKPYAYDTHKSAYADVHKYFQADLAYMKDFNTTKYKWNPKYLLIVVDGVSG